MIDLANRQVWIFREPRTGSSAFTESIRKLLGRGSIFVESPDQIIYDSSVVVSMHIFDFLKFLKREDKPIVLRCSRKNRLQQFLSLRAMLATNFSNIRINNPESGLCYNTDEVLNFESFIKKNKITISYEDFSKFRSDSIRTNLSWNYIASNFDHQVFYYENLNKIIDIPILNMYNINIEAEKYTKKLPDYKEELFTNISEVKKWMIELPSF